MSERSPGSVAPVPLTVITGFLGSGKTTLLNRLIHDPAIGRVAVIVNELGEVGLDNLLVDSAAEDTVLLDSGCLCCSIRNDLVQTLLSLQQRREAGAVPPFTRLVVETTGLADPAPILHTLMSAPLLSGFCFLDGIITTVDGEQGEARLDEYGEAARQAAVADRLVITKTDLAPAQRVQRLAQRLAELNPGAPPIRAPARRISARDLLNSGLYDTERAQVDLRRWLPEARYRRRGEDSPVHDARIQAHCLYRRDPVSRAVLGMWLAELTRDFGARLLRLKGVVNVAGAARPLVVQGVQHRLYPPATLPQWPDADRRTRVVIIARGLSSSQIEDSLAAVESRLRPAGAAAPEPA